MMARRASAHEETWLLLPWLANGRLSQSARDRLEEHLRECASCTQELARQRLMCEALTEPDRVTYAPGPSFRKLMERIDRESAAAPRPPPVPEPRRAASAAGSAAAAAWRPPGLAWAASFVLVMGLATVASTAYRWSQPRYATHTSATRATPGVLHVVFDRSLPIGEMEELLHATGARVVEGPGAAGIFGVAPVAAGAQQASDASAAALSALAARLRADARVRWVEPLAETEWGAAERRTPER